MTLKGSRYRFALSRIFAFFVVPNTNCAKRPHQTHLRGFTELSTKASLDFHYAPFCGWISFHPFGALVFNSF
jgi:hypothetical protein